MMQSQQAMRIELGATQLQTWRALLVKKATRKGLADQPPNLRKRQAQVCCPPAGPASSSTWQGVRSKPTGHSLHESQTLPEPTGEQVPAPYAQDFSGMSKRLEKDSCNEKGTVTRKENFPSFRNALRKASACPEAAYAGYFERMELPDSLRLVAWACGRQSKRRLSRSCQKLTKRFRQNRRTSAHKLGKWL